MCPWEKIATFPSVALNSASTAIGARSHRGSILAAGTAVAPQVPIGPRGVDLARGEPLVLAVVPLHQVLAHLRFAVEPCERAGFARSRGRADEHALEAPRGEPLREAGSSGASGIGERDVGSPGVAPVAAPLGLGVTHEHEFESIGRYVG